MSIKVVVKDWGKEVWLVNSDLYCAKYLHIKAGHWCSMHRHIVKDETFLVLSGECDLEIGNTRKHLKFWESQRIAPGTWHRFSAKSDCVILEVSTHHDDADVQRLTVSGKMAHSITPSPESVLMRISENGELLCEPFTSKPQTPGQSREVAGTER